MLGTKIFACKHLVAGAEFVDIDYTVAEFTSLPIIVASVEQDDINVHITNITTDTARIEFSEKFYGRVGYIVRSAT